MRRQFKPSLTSTQPASISSLKTVVFLLVGVPFLLLFMGLGGLLICAGANTLSSGNASPEAATATRRTGFRQNERSKMAFSGRAAQLFGAGSICLGTWFCVESVLLGVSIWINELVVGVSTKTKKSYQSLAKKIGLCFRIGIGICLGGAIVLQVIQMFW